MTAPTRELKYPVLVTYTYRHVVWVEADCQQGAVEQLQDAPYDSTSDSETLAATWWEVAAPDRWDWSDVEDGDYGYRGTLADEHVQTHRAHRHRVERAHLEATADDEDREIAAGRMATADRRTCPVCPAWLEDGHEQTRHHVDEVAWRARERGGAR